MEISQNFAAFSEYMNFTCVASNCNQKGGTKLASDYLQKLFKYLKFVIARSILNEQKLNIQGNDLMEIISIPCIDLIKN